jgi:hypothetical protein
VQWLPDGMYEYVVRWVSLQRALEVAKSYTAPKRPSVLLGITKRVQITDGGDSTVFDWRNGEGIVWPARGPDGQYTEDGPEPPPWEG